MLGFGKVTFEEHRQMTDQNTILGIIKACSMLVIFLLILVHGSIPIRVQAYKKKLLSFTVAFSGGLFLFVGLLHLLPESQEQMENYYKERQEDGDYFPFVFLTLIFSYSFILWIEEIATDAHQHPQDDEQDPYQGIKVLHNE